jgi:hypothetical protein
MLVTAAQPLFHHQFPLSQKLPRINSPASGLRLETRKILLAHQRSLASFIPHRSAGFTFAA